MATDATLCKPAKTYDRYSAERLHHLDARRDRTTRCTATRSGSAGSDARHVYTEAPSNFITAYPPRPPIAHLAIVDGLVRHCGCSRGHHKEHHINVPRFTVLENTFPSRLSSHPPRFNLLDALACEYLSQNTTILTLDVRSNPIGEAGLANLAGSLRLQTLAVGPVASHTLPAFPFPSSLLRNSLTSLRIEYTRMKANEALQGLDSLMRHSSLTYLELVHCGFSTWSHLSLFTITKLSNYYYIIILITLISSHYLENGELSSEILNASKLVHFSLIDQGINADVSCTNPSLISLHLPYSCRISAAPPNLYYTSHYHVLANVRLRLEQLKRDRENIFRLALALAMERARLNSTCLLSRMPSWNYH